MDYLSLAFGKCIDDNSDDDCFDHEIIHRILNDDDVEGLSLGVNPANDSSKITDDVVAKGLDSEIDSSGSSPPSSSLS